MKAILVSLGLLTSSELFADGHDYSVHTIMASHTPTYATPDFESTNIKIQSSLLRDELVLRVEVFVIPAGPGYKVLIGKMEPKVTVSSKETEYILSEVRRLLIEAKQERESKASEKKTANQSSQPTSLTRRG